VNTLIALTLACYFRENGRENGSLEETIVASHLPMINRSLYPIKGL
jgi:hypothetical protein